MSQSIIKRQLTPLSITKALNINDNRRKVKGENVNNLIAISCRSQITTVDKIDRQNTRNFLPLNL